MRIGVELETELLVGFSVAVPLVNILVVGGGSALVVGVYNFEESSFDGGDSEMLSVGTIYGPVVVSVAVVASVSFQVEDLSVEGGDSPEVPVDLVQLVSLLVFIVAGGEVVLGALAEASGDTVSIGSDLDANILSVRNIRGGGSRSIGVKFETVELVITSVALTLRNFLVVRGVKAIVNSVHDFEVRSNERDYFVVLVYKSFIIFEVEIFSVEGGDFPENPVYLGYLKSLLVSIVARGEVGLGVAET